MIPSNLVPILLNKDTLSPKLYVLFGCLSLLCFGLSIQQEAPVLSLLPLGLLAFLVLIFKPIYTNYLLLISLPLALDVPLPSGLNTDFPSEQFLWILTPITVILVMRRFNYDIYQFIKHPLSVILLVSIVWLLITSIFSEIPVRSLKFFLAKLWYIIPFFYFYGIFAYKSDSSWRTHLWLVLIPLTLVTFQTIMKHWLLYAWDFHDINFAVLPYFHNHVDYAAQIALVLPTLFFLRRWYPKHTVKRLIINVSMAILLFGMLTAYTRAAYLAFAMACGYYLVVHYKITKLVLVVAFIGTSIGFFYLIHNKKYLDYRPSLDTVIHTDFNSLVSATTELKDASTMERYHRWIGAIRSLPEHPIMGYGPNNFYNFYRRFTVTSFTTYISDNFDQSGVHCYFIMTAMEQGLVGLLILLIFTAAIFIHAQRIWHETTDPRRKDVVMSAIMMLVVNYAFNLMNDFIESDELGSFYFISIAMLVACDLKNKKELKLSASLNK